MARPDGSFFTHPTNLQETFAMALALPNSTDGNPIEKTLRVFVFRDGNRFKDIYFQNKIFSNLKNFFSY